MQDVCSDFWSFSSATPESWLFGRYLMGGAQYVEITWNFTFQVPVAVNIQRDSVGPAITEQAESKWGDECFKSAAHGNFPHRPLFKKLTRMATVHATLLLAKLVPSLLEELHLLLQLLSLEPENAGDGSVHTIIRTAPVAEVVHEKDNLFSSGYDCAGYACAVLEQAGHILDCGK